MSISYGDHLTSLPVDKSTPSHEEEVLMDNLFKAPPTLMEKVSGESKQLLVLGVVFAALSVPPVDALIQSVVPATRNSPYVLVAVKTLLFLTIYAFLSYVVKAD